MAGFDAPRTRELFDLDDTVDPICVIAVGYHEANEALPADTAARDTKARERLALEDIVFRMGLSEVSPVVSAPSDAK